MRHGKNLHSISSFDSSLSLSGSLFYMVDMYTLRLLFGIYTYKINFPTFFPLCSSVLFIYRHFCLFLFNVRYIYILFSYLASRIYRFGSFYCEYVTATFKSIDETANIQLLMAQNLKAIKLYWKSYSTTYERNFVCSMLRKTNRIAESCTPAIAFSLQITIETRQLYDTQSYRVTPCLDLSSMALGNKKYIYEYTYTYLLRL